MVITEAANRNHETLCPDYKSILKDTDPEFIEVFDAFASGEVLAHGALDEGTRLKVILAALIASQSLGEFKVMVRAALNVGVTPIEVKEIVYQAVPYCGIAIVFDFLHATNEILESLGVKLPLEGQSTTSPETRFENGLALQKAIFGDMIETLQAEAPKDQAHIQRFLSSNCFGDHVSRSGLELRLRELLTFSMLLSLGGCESQLRGHIRGNLNLGNDRSLLMDVITQVLPYVGYPRTLNAMRCLDEVAPLETEIPAAPGESPRR